MAGTAEQRVAGVLAVVGAGGAAGALARYAIDLAFPAAGITGAFPWPTLVINVVGCLLIGALSGALSHDRWWVRPLVVAGVLGGFTTTSAFALETGALLDAGDAVTALAYLAATLALGLIAVVAGERMAAAARP